MHLGSRNAGAEPQNGAEDSNPNLILSAARLALYPVKWAIQLHQARKSASAMLLFGA